MKTKIIPPTQSAFQHQLLIKDLLIGSRRKNNRKSNRIIYRDLIEYDYQGFYARVCQLANLLTEKGVEAGDTVAVMDWDSHRYLECYFAVPMIGAVLHHVNVRLSPEQIVYTMNHAEDKLVLVHEDFLPLVEQVEDHLTTVEQYILLTDQSSSASSLSDSSPAPDTSPSIDASSTTGLSPTSGLSLAIAGEYEDLLCPQSEHYDFPEFDENSVATTFYTTGTTGNPKGVYFSHRQLVLHTLGIANELSTGSGGALMNVDSVYMPLTPMFHVHAWGLPYIATMLGVQQVYPGRYEPQRLVDMVQQHKVSFSHCVPTILQMVLDAGRQQGLSFDDWSVIIGGSALSQSLAKDALALGVNVLAGYGMSETCPVLAVAIPDQEVLSLPLEEQLAHRIPAGTVVNLVDVQLMDADGALLPHDGKSVGEVVVRAPWLTQGYLKESENSEQLWQGGWLHTGDLGTLSAKGTLELKDRLKDVIKTGGEWISSIELEDLISEMPQVASVAVVGVADEQWGERPVAIIVPVGLTAEIANEVSAEQEGKTAVELQQVCDHLMQYVNNGHINKWWLPEQIKLVDDLPKTSVGKIDKKLLRSQL